jgi:hypothetical protein
VNSGLSRMRLRIVRTVARSSALPDASTKQPWLNIAAFPYPLPAMLGIALRPIVLPLEYWGQSSARPLRTRACPQLSQMTAAAKWMPARKFLAVLS